MSATQLKERRVDKLDFRVSRTAKNKLQAAASVSHRSVSDFVMESALSKAEEVLADRRTFGLNEVPWKALQDALDSPPRPLPKLKALLNDAGFWGKDRSVSSDRRIELLNPGHAVHAFDCGQADLNTWLQRFALQTQAANGARTYVGMAGDIVVGYYSLSVGQVEYEGAADRLRKGLAKHPIPIMLLARLAVHLDWQKKGVGRALLREAILRTIEASRIAGIRALVVHAKDDEARRYYEQFDFAPSPTDPLHLYVLVKDIRKIFE